MAAFNFFDDFFHQLGLETHNLHTDTLKVYLTNAAPSAANTVFDTPAEITNENGYDAPVDVTNTYTEASGVGTCASADSVTITADGGTIGPFQYVVLYNEDATSDNLIGWWADSAERTLADGESYEIDFGASLFTVQVTA